MDETTDSVAKGVFVFKNSFKRKNKRKTIDVEQNDKLSNPFANNLWYQQYNNVWTELEQQLKDIGTNIFTSMTQDVMDFLKKSHITLPQEVPTAVLLTGINMPDHAAQFKSLEDQIKSEISPHVACLKCQEGSSLKYIIESMIGQFVRDDKKDFESEDEENSNKPSIKKSSLCFGLLEFWYDNLIKNGAKKSSNPLVIIIPDFESFNLKVLKHFILIISSYIEKLPFVFCFGVATSLNTLQTSFPYHVIAKISIKVFKCEKSIEHLNKILDEVFLTRHSPVQFGPKNMKYAIMEHFCYGNAMSLCTSDKSEVKDILFNEFDHEDLENVRQLMSFRKLVESETYENRIKLLIDDSYFKNQLFEYVITIQKYIRRLHIFLKCLHVLVADLPGAPLGKHLREIYPNVLQTNFTRSPEFIECFKLLNFQSKDELRRKVNKTADIIYGALNKNTKKTELKQIYEEVLNWIEKLDNIDQQDLNEANWTEIQEQDITFNNQTTNRKALKEALLNKTKQKPNLNRYEKLREEILIFFKLTFAKFLVEPSSYYFYEIFFFDDISIQNKLIGSHRSAIHQALSNPNHYLQCKCCKIPNSSSIKSCMPDICIAYKLHLECGKMINLYDWLQAFLCILDPTDQDEDESKKVVDPELQARFTQCVAELEHLGFIKSSKRKLDHVARLTWGI